MPAAAAKTLRAPKSSRSATLPKVAIMSRKIRFLLVAAGAIVVAAVNSNRPGGDDRWGSGKV